MRNVVAYGTARWMGRYAARTRFVELRLNGRYHGVYVLMEKLELGDDRVAGRGAVRVHLPVPGAVEGAVVPHARSSGARSCGRTPSAATSRARAPSALAATVRAAERALYGPRELAAPPRRGARRSTSSCVNELFKNQDAFHASTYMALRGRQAPARPGVGLRHLDGQLGLRPSSRLARLDARAPRLGGAALPRPALHARGSRPAGASCAARACAADVLAEIDAAARRELRGAIGRNFRRWPVLDRRDLAEPASRRGSHARRGALPALAG